MARPVALTIDAYLAAQPDRVRVVLERLRTIIRSVLPDAEEAISYQIPVFKIDGRAVIYLAGWTAHVALYPATGRVATELADEIAPYKASKGTLRFPLDKPVPARLVSKIVKLRAEEARAAARQVKARRRR
ncbi:MAG: DUF1801 domain-containing protein [Hyphomicrobiaceae bacterium]